MWLVVALFVTEPLNPCQLFEFGDRIKAKLSYDSYVTCQPPGHSKYHKICDTDTSSRYGKVPIFKPKALRFYSKYFSYVNQHFPIENRPNFGFLGEPEP